MPRATTRTFVELPVGTAFCFSECWCLHGRASLRTFHLPSRKTPLRRRYSRPARFASGNKCCQPESLGLRRSTQRKEAMDTKKKINRLRFGRLLAVAALVLASAVVASSASAAAPTSSSTQAQARRADGRGHRGERQDRASPAGRQPGILQVDVGDDGSADFSFARKQVATIAVDARAGDDLVRIDDSNGAFTDTIPTTIDGGDGNDTIAGGRGNESLLGGAGERLDRRQRRQRPGAAGRRRRHLRLGSGRRQRHDRRPGRHRHDALQRRQRRRAASTCPRTDNRLTVLPRSRQHHDGHRTASSGSTSTPSAAPTSSPSTT